MTSKHRLFNCGKRCAEFRWLRVARPATQMHLYHARFVLERSAFSLEKEIIRVEGVKP